MSRNLLLFPVVSIILLMGKNKVNSSLLNNHIPDKVLVNTITTIKSTESCHTHFVIDDEHGPYINAVLKTREFPLTINNIPKNDHELVKKKAEEIIKLYLPNPKFPEQDLQTYFNLTKFPPLNVNQVKMVNNQFSCLLVFVLLRPSLEEFFEYGAIRNSVQLLIIEKRVGIPFKKRLGIFQIVLENNLRNFESVLRKDSGFCFNLGPRYFRFCYWLPKFRNSLMPYERFPVEGYFLISPNKTQIKFLCGYKIKKPNWKQLFDIKPMSFHLMNDFIAKKFPSPLFHDGHVENKKNLIFIQLKKIFNASELRWGSSSFILDEELKNM